ncbi:MAG: peptide-methionine (S)-S-oxide reductase MsrA [Deltaproteobacteria bacterium]|nr:peptide-methionine (S)-S-oxide reductase MsrA [Deltaproteobacteria bacterium]
MKTWLKIVLPIALLGFLVVAYAQKEEKNTTSSDKSQAIATFAGGCFWCMEPPYDELDGVISTTSGYIGGKEKNPTYQDVAEGLTGHAEAVQVAYDPAKVSYGKLLEVFWRNIDPFTANAQFCDHGKQYRTAVFYHGDEQKRLAEASKVTLEKSGRFSQPIVTEIVPAGEFYVAEDYHQNYYVNNPTRYKYYRYRCGRDAKLEEIWGKPKEAKH